MPQVPLDAPTTKPYAEDRWALRALTAARHGEQGAAGGPSAFYTHPIKSKSRSWKLGTLTPPAGPVVLSKLEQPIITSE